MNPAEKSTVAGFRDDSRRENPDVELVQSAPRNAHKEVFHD
jgi:hypothetical protein